MTKIIIDPVTERILGFGIAGRDAEGMISEGALPAHPHPTLSETVGEVAEIFLAGNDWVCFVSVQEVFKKS